MVLQLKPVEHDAARASGRSGTSIAVRSSTVASFFRLKKLRAVKRPTAGVVPRYAFLAWKKTLLHNLDVLGFGALRVFDDVELDDLTLSKAAES